MFEAKPKDCMIWKGTISNGYGRLSIKGKTWLVHRLVMAIVKPEEFKKYPQVNHRCDNPACYNPYHLYCGTHQDNMDDIKLKKTPFRLRPEHREAKKRAKTKMSTARQNTMTDIVTFRIFKTQIQALKNLPSGYVSISAFMRTLLQIYLDGKIPELLPPAQVQRLSKTENAA